MILFAAVALALSAPVAAEAQALGQLYIEALDADGQVVPDLTVRDFIVLEDDTRVGIVSAERVGPMKVALLIDNDDRMSELAAFYPLRDAIEAFLDTLGPEHEVALFTIARSIQRRVDFTMDREALRESVEEIVLDSGAGALLLDGIKETWERGYESDETLPAMVLILTDGPESSRNYSDTEYANLVNTLIFNGVMVNVLQLSGRGGSIRGGNISTMPGYARDIADNTGGGYQTITTATGMPEWMERYAERLNAHYAEMSKRYRVRYEPPDPRGARSPREHAPASTSASSSTFAWSSERAAGAKPRTAGGRRNLTNPALEQRPPFAAVAGVRPVPLATRADDERQVVPGCAADNLELVRLAGHESIRERVLTGTPRWGLAAPDQRFDARMRLARARRARVRELDRSGDPATHGVARLRVRGDLHLDVAHGCGRVRRRL